MAYLTSVRRLTYRAAAIQPALNLVFCGISPLGLQGCRPGYQHKKHGKRHGTRRAKDTGIIMHAKVRVYGHKYWKGTSERGGVQAVIALDDEFQ